jgi:hypothetical protein
MPQPHLAGGGDLLGGLSLWDEDDDDEEELELPEPELDPLPPDEELEVDGLPCNEAQADGCKETKWENCI